MKAMKVFIVFFGLLVSLPIGIYLQFKILTLVQATDVMWLLFWVNIPVMLLINIFSKIIEVLGERSN